MKEKGSIIGGEGNGGIIFPELHYGRDALVGIALFLTHLAKFGKPVGFLRKNIPTISLQKENRIESRHRCGWDFGKNSEKYAKYDIDLRDGVKIYFDKEWVHLRKSNTEPIIRIYAESEFETKADNLADKIISDIKEAMIS